MKLGIIQQPIDPNSPWGGGNTHYARLVEQASKIFKVEEVNKTNKYDIIYVQDCRWLFISNDKLPTIVEYKAMKPKTKFILRVGDVGTHDKPEILNKLIDLINMEIIDCMIFTSEWAKRYLSARIYPSSSLKMPKMYVIPNEADEIFFPAKKLKVVTHHWSNNRNKGGEIYETLQARAEQINVEFTFIGRPCFNIVPPTIHIPAQNKSNLMSLLQQYDWYLTASIHEAGANHVLEAYNAGLPILYHIDGGSIPEYISKRGIPYKNYAELENILSPNPTLSQRIDQYMAIIIQNAVSK